MLLALKYKIEKWSVFTLCARDGEFPSLNGEGSGMHEWCLKNVCEQDDWFWTGEVTRIADVWNSEWLGMVVSVLVRVLVSLESWELVKISLGGGCELLDSASTGLVHCSSCHPFCKLQFPTGFKRLLSIFITMQYKAPPILTRPGRLPTYKLSSNSYFIYTV